MDSTTGTSTEIIPVSGRENFLFPKIKEEQTVDATKQDTFSNFQKNEESQQHKGSFLLSRNFVEEKGGYVTPSTTEDRRRSILGQIDDTQKKINELSFRHKSNSFYHDRRRSEASNASPTLFAQADQLRLASSFDTESSYNYPPSNHFHSSGNNFGLHQRE